MAPFQLSVLSGQTTIPNVTSFSVYNALASNTTHRLRKDLFLQNTASNLGLRTLRHEGLGHCARLRTMVIKGTKSRIVGEFNFECQQWPQDEF